MTETVNGRDRRRITELLGREPRGDYAVAVRHADGTPLVIANAPFLDDGTPMPTRWWLVGEPERTWIGRLEARGGVAEVQTALPEDVIAAAHQRYAAERDALIPPDHAGPRPFGGVGGTRRGVKCLHAHYAWWLAGGDDPVGAWVAGELRDQGFVANVAPQRDSDVVAAIDCGTNSTRLLIGRGNAGGGIDTVLRRMEITRLGAGVDATGRLDPVAIGRTLDVLSSYRDDIDGNGVGRIRATATSAARDASNRDAFFAPVAAELGIELELLSGSQEASLSFAGATADLRAHPGTYLAVDIGGGSTEFAVGSISAAGHATVHGAVSVDIGCVRITERFLTSDPPSAEELRSARSHCEQVVGEALAQLPDSGAATTLLGLAGTVSTLASIDQGLVDYDRNRIHHHVLDAGRVAASSEQLLGMPAARRIAVPGMEAGRAEVIAGGLVVLEAVLERTGHASLVVSEADILDGLAASIIPTIGS